MKYSVIVPCYNEEDNICRLVEVLERTAGHRKVEFILVENGSQDNTKQVLEETCKDKNIFKIVRVDKNRGYGYGIICGMRRLQEIILAGFMQIYKFLPMR